jgi:hypothetical protein
MGKLARALAALDQRLLELDAQPARAEYRRLSARIDSGWNKTVQIDDAIEAMAKTSILALGAILLIRISFDDDEDHVMGMYHASLAGIRPQLVGPIAEEADRVLAEATEV